MSALSTALGLTERQAEFVKCYIITGDIGGSALKAGYSSVVDGSRLLRLSHVVAAVHREIQRQLISDVAPLAFRTIRRMLEAPDTPHGVRADLAIKAMRLAGHVQPTNRDQVAEKAPSEMTRDEMLAWIDRNQAEIDKAEAELARRAKDVSDHISDQEQAVIAPKPLQFLD